MKNKKYNVNNIANLEFISNGVKDKCASCKICCKFPEKYSPLIPYFMDKEIKDPQFFSCIGNTYGCRINLVKYACPYFNADKNNCGKYSSRPLDCKLYPFMITYNKDYSKVVLVLDNNCPYAEGLLKLRNEAVDFINKLDFAAQNIGFINDFQKDAELLCELPKLTQFIFGSDGNLRKIQKHEMPLYLWKDIMNVLSSGNIFYHGFNGRFIKIDKNTAEYVYTRKGLIDLKGNKYKDKRNLCNHFQNNYNYEIRKLKKDDTEECLGLYQRWAGMKFEKQKDVYEKQLIEDSFYFHRRAFWDFSELGLEGIAIYVNSKLAGYTFGYRQNENTFCILGEITDQSYKGINQFIFREFCRIIPDNFIYINAMDDSGIEGLKKNKLSYKPIKRVI